MLMLPSTLVESAVEHPGKRGVQIGTNARAFNLNSHVALALAADHKRRFHCQIGNCRSATPVHLAGSLFLFYVGQNNPQNEKAEL